MELDSKSYGRMWESISNLYNDRVYFQGIQTPSTTKTDLSTLQYLKSAIGFSRGVSLDPTQVGKSSSLTADICLGVTGTYDLNNQKSSGLPNSWGFGSVGGGVWKNRNYRGADL